MNFGSHTRASSTSLPGQSRPVAPRHLGGRRFISAAPLFQARKHTPGRFTNCNEFRSGFGRDGSGLSTAGKISQGGSWRVRPTAQMRTPIARPVKIYKRRLTPASTDGKVAQINHVAHHDHRNGMESFVRTKNDRVEARKVTVTASDVRGEMQGIIRSLARPGEPKKSLWWRLSRLFDLTPGQVERLDYGNWKNIPAHIADTVRARADAERLDAIREQRDAIAAIYQQIQTLESRMAISDMDFHQPQIDALGELRNGAGRKSGGAD